MQLLTTTTKLLSAFTVVAASVAAADEAASPLRVFPVKIGDMIAEYVCRRSSRVLENTTTYVSIFVFLKELRYMYVHVKYIVVSDMMFWQCFPPENKI